MRVLVALIAVSSTARAGGLAAAEAVPALERAVATVDPKAPIGAAVAIAELAPSTDVAADAKIVRDALAARGYRILLDADDSGTVTITATIGTARATIRLAAQGSSIALTAHPSATRPPGPCVAIPTVAHEVYLNSHAIGQDGELHEGHTLWALRSHHAIDVDGDGIPDVLVPAPASKHQCPDQMTWHVYVVRGACGHDVGAIGPAAFDIALDGPLDAAGFHPLRATSQWTTTGARGIPQMTTTTTRFAMQRGAYAKLDAKTSSGVCHHCARWSCSSATP